MEFDAAAIGYRIAGSFLGTFCALVIVEPQTGREFCRRGGVSLVMGLVFADVTADYLQWSMIVPNRIIVASFLSALLGWWIADGVIRLARTRLGDYVRSAFRNGKAKG
jgi:hypothetical protein